MIMVSIPPHPDFEQYKVEMYAAAAYEGLAQGDQWDYRGNYDGTRAKRRKWWKDICIEDETMADAARRIHPTGIHTCTGCGTLVEISTEKTYLVSKTETELTGKMSDEILELINIYGENEGLVQRQVPTPIGGYHALFDDKKLLRVAFMPHIPLFAPGEILLLERFERWSGRVVLHQNDSELMKCLEGYYGRFEPNQHGRGNAPDRFDGLHCYNVCCKEPLDPGRDPANMAQYGRDRRALELLSSGAHRIANRLMKEINTLDLVGDHIGPLICGFAHDPSNLQAINEDLNREFWYWLNLDKVEQLISIEEGGGKITSVHISMLWDATKAQIISDEKARKLTFFLKAMTKFNLFLLAEILQEHPVTGHEFICSLIDNSSQYSNPTFTRNPNVASGFDIKIIHRDDNEKIEKTIKRNNEVLIENLGSLNSQANRDYHILRQRYQSLADEMDSVLDHVSDVEDTLKAIGSFYSSSIESIQICFSETFLSEMN